MFSFNISDAGRDFHVKNAQDQLRNKYFPHDPCLIFSPSSVIASVSAMAVGSARVVSIVHCIYTFYTHSH